MLYGNEQGNHPVGGAAACALCSRCLAPLRVFGIEHFLRTAKRRRHEMTVRRIRDVDVPVTQPRSHIRDRYTMRQQRAHERVPQAVRGKSLRDTRFVLQSVFHG